MSQVIIPHDVLQRARDRTHLEEKKILRMELPPRWVMSDVTQTRVIEKLLGLLCLPLVGCWAFLLACASIGLALCLGLFRVGNQFIRFFHIR